MMTPGLPGHEPECLCEGCVRKRTVADIVEVAHGKGRKRYETIHNKPSSVKTEGSDHP